MGLKLGYTVGTFDTYGRLSALSCRWYKLQHLAHWALQEPSPRDPRTAGLG